MLTRSRRFPLNYPDPYGMVRRVMWLSVVGGMALTSGCSDGTAPEEGTYEGTLSGTITLKGQTSTLASVTLEPELQLTADGYDPPTSIFEAVVPGGTAGVRSYSISGLELLFTTLGWTVSQVFVDATHYDQSAQNVYSLWGYGDVWLPTDEANSSQGQCFITLEMGGTLTVQAATVVALDLQAWTWIYDYTYSSNGSSCVAQYGSELTLTYAGELTLVHGLMLE